MDINIISCEDSIEGIFTAIYEAYEMKFNPGNTQIQTQEYSEIRLFANYISSLPNLEKTRKVVHTLQRDFGEEAYYCICQAVASCQSDKADTVYHAIEAGLRMKNKRRFMENLRDPAICRLFELSRNVNNEIMHLKGFLRFQELENRILFSKIGPKNNIITFLTSHFQDRLPCENFVIYDSTRNLVTIHPKGKPFIVSNAEDLNPAAYENYSSQEAFYQELFRHFCNKIAIKERKNLNLQRQMLPLRFREYMVEF